MEHQGVRKIHIAEVNPPRCSSCYSQKPDLRHVDFSAYYDGPVVPAAEGEGVVQVAIDDLVICEQCLKEAAELVGMGDTEREREEIQRLRYELEAAAEREAAAVRLVSQLEKAAEARDELEALVARPAPESLAVA